MADKRRPTSKGGGPDEQVEILRAIWAEMKAVHGQIKETNARLDAVRIEVKDEMDVLRRRIVESEVRLATATTQLSGDVQELTGLIRE